MKQHNTYDTDKNAHHSAPEDCRYLNKYLDYRCIKKRRELNSKAHQ